LGLLLGGQFLAEFQVKALDFCNFDGDTRQQRNVELRIKTTLEFETIRLSTENSYLQDKKRNYEIGKILLDGINSCIT